MEERINLLKTLADPTRMKLLKLLLLDEFCVCELQELLQISQPAVSQHMAKLKTAGLAQERRAGMWTYYKADRTVVEGQLQALAQFILADPAAAPSMSGEMERLATLNRVDICKK